MGGAGAAVVAGRRANRSSARSRTASSERTTRSRRRRRTPSPPQDGRRRRSPASASRRCRTPSCPPSGPGTAPNGNFVLTEFKVALRPAAGESRRKPCRSSCRRPPTTPQDGYPVANAIDGKPDTGWAVLPQVGKPHEAVFETRSADRRRRRRHDAHVHAGVPARAFPQHNIGKFRLSATTAPHPARPRSLPAVVKAASAVAPDERTDAQKNDDRRLLPHDRAAARPGAGEWSRPSRSRRRTCSRPCRRAS